jgi:hypothetical protein
MQELNLQEELDSLQPGEVRKREPARPPHTNSSSRSYAQQAMGGSMGDPSLPLLARVALSMRNQRNLEAGGASQDQQDEYAGTWENLSLDSSGLPLLERRDVWGLHRENQGIQFGNKKDLGPS